MNIRIIFLLISAMLAVSTSPIIARMLPGVPAVTISFWRMGFGAIIMWTLSLVKPDQKMTVRSRNRSILAGIFLGIHFALFFASIKLTTIANATFLGTLAPLFTLVIEKTILKRRHSATVPWGLALALCGSCVILVSDFNFTSDKTIGNLLAVLCSAFLGAAFIISENVRKKEGTIIYSRTLFLSATVTLGVIAFLIHSPLLGYNRIEYGWLLLLGVIPTIFGHGSMYYTLKYVSPTIVASTPLGEPILASIIAWYLFLEPVGILIIIGGGITLSGLFLLILKR